VNYGSILWNIWAFQVALVVKNPPAISEDVRNMGSIPGSGRSPGGGHSNPLQYSCLENHMESPNIPQYRTIIHLRPYGWT